MKIPYYQVNAFTGAGFKGNPAGVCILDHWIEEKMMQDIAFENNLAETAFIVRNKLNFDIRWFTPRVEVDLCGHATLAAAFVLMGFINSSLTIVDFMSKSGLLKVFKKDDGFVLNFPVDTISEIKIEPVFAEVFQIPPVKAYRGKTDYLLIFKNEKEIRNMTVRMDLVATLRARGVIITAPGDSVDFVSRFFAPQSGIPEDPVTGSAHTTLVPYWAEKLNKFSLKAWQLSERGGELVCTHLGDRVEIGGVASLHFEGFIHI
jgi:PhzF family phenazine biosynthesis protein